MGLVHRMSVSLDILTNILIQTIFEKYCFRKNFERKKYCFKKDFACLQEQLNTKCFHTSAAHFALSVRITVFLIFIVRSKLYFNS